METVRDEDFLQWAADIGIGFDPRYPKSGCLSLLPPSHQHARFWVLPPDPSALPHFAASSLDGLDEWDSGFLWHRSGRWPDPARSQGYIEGVRDVLLRGAGIPGGWAGAVRFRREEEDRVIAVLYAFLAFGSCTFEDVFFVPDHGKQLLRTDHHDVIHITCASEERVQKLVAHMAARGCELPTELPDETFRRSEWMSQATPVDVVDRPRE